ncbi:MAG: hypothetical protein KGS61_17945, partial [Verrucomicrobia bacterium]|nr:hypothetical protein [Verrucomicrobiota bacterium]
RDPQAWQYRDGAFIASATSSLARDFHVRGSASLEFDLAWTGSFEMILVLYTDVLDRLDYNASSYLVFLGSGFVNVQRVQSGFGVLQLGQSALPELLKKNHAHFELRALKDQSTLELRVDGGPVYRWKDARGLLTQGPGIVFFPQLDNSSGRLSLSDLRVCSWDGPTESEATTNPPPAGDWVRLVNHDQLTGTLRGVHDGKLTVVTAQTQLDIPLSRVTQILLDNAPTNRPPTSPRQTRAFFAGGTILSLQLEQWEGQQVSGQSDIFGHLALRSQPIRRLQFNLDRSAPDDAPPAASAKDEGAWDE